MRVIIVNDFGYVEGGATAVAIETALQFKKAGIDVLYFCGKGPVAPELIDAGVKTVCLDMESILSDPNRIRAICLGINNANVGKQLASLLRSYDPKDTVIHIHTWTKVLSSSIYDVVRDLKFPTFVTAHDYFLVCPNGGLYNYQTKKICRLEPMSKQCITCNCDRRSQMQKYWRCIRQAKQNASIYSNKKIRYFAVSEYQKKILEHLLPKGTRCEVLRNPIATIASPGTTPTKREKFVFLGRVVPEKGVDLFCEAVDRISAKGVVVGDGELLEPLKERSPSIEFLGWRSKDDLDDVIEDALACVAPSRWHETALLSPLEFMEHEVPCIVPDECAASEYVVEGINGYIFKTGDVVSLAEKMSLMLEKPLIPERPQFGSEDYLNILLDRYNRALGDQETASCIPDGENF